MGLTLAVPLFPPSFHTPTDPFVCFPLARLLVSFLHIERSLHLQLPVLPLLHPFSLFHTLRYTSTLSYYPATVYHNY